MQVEQLSKDVHAKQPVTIVHTGGVDKGTSYVLYTTATLGLGTVLYFKIFRGWSVGDFMYVTRRGLRQGITQVTSGLEALSGKVTDIKTKLQARIAELGRKQDETIAAQAALKQQLSRVGGDVEVTRGQVGQVRRAAWWRLGRGCCAGFARLGHVHARARVPVLAQVVAHAAACLADAVLALLLLPPGCESCPPHCHPPASQPPISPPPADPWPGAGHGGHHV